jgi:hypothetical protein
LEYSPLGEPNQSFGWGRDLIPVPTHKPDQNLNKNRRVSLNKLKVDYPALAGLDTPNNIYQ